MRARLLTGDDRLGRRDSRARLRRWSDSARLRRWPGRAGDGPPWLLGRPAGQSGQGVLTGTHVAVFVDNGELFGAPGVDMVAAQLLGGPTGGAGRALRLAPRHASVVGLCGPRRCGRGRLCWTPVHATGRRGGRSALRSGETGPGLPGVDGPNRGPAIGAQLLVAPWIGQRARPTLEGTVAVPRLLIRLWRTGGGRRGRRRLGGGRTAGGVE
ncbi:hypothetical protein GCM10010201_04770 [Pilimelia columellifera subsp. columellifera]|uniref:Uncharacterized protein n=1 Tax=Pilimelia columellifera subsp. columellifera TaxID=706583 RepID=A0ABN3N5G5_9ACTN